MPRACVTAEKQSVGTFNGHVWLPLKHVRFNLCALVYNLKCFSNQFIKTVHVYGAHCDEKPMRVTCWAYPVYSLATCCKMIVFVRNRASMLGMVFVSSVPAV